MMHCPIDHRAAYFILLHHIYIKYSLYYTRTHFFFINVRFLCVLNSNTDMISDVSFTFIYLFCFYSVSISVFFVVAIFSIFSNRRIVNVSDVCLKYSSNRRFKQQLSRFNCVFNGSHRLYTTILGYMLLVCCTIHMSVCLWCVCAMCAVCVCVVIAMVIGVRKIYGWIANKKKHTRNKFILCVRCYGF